MYNLWRRFIIYLEFGKYEWHVARKRVKRVWLTKTALYSAFMSDQFGSNYSKGIKLHKNLFSFYLHFLTLVAFIEVSNI